MEEFLQVLKMPDLAKRLWNVDYTGFCTAVASQWVLAKRGAKDVHETAGGGGGGVAGIMSQCWGWANSYFPGLINQLWAASFMPEHNKGGFRAGGVYSLT